MQADSCQRNKKTVTNYCIRYMGKNFCQVDLYGSTTILVGKYRKNENNNQIISIVQSSSMDCHRNDAIHLIIK